MECLMHVCMCVCVCMNIRVCVCVFVCNCPLSSTPEGFLGPRANVEFE